MHTVRFRCEVSVATGTFNCTPGNAAPIGEAAQTGWTFIYIYKLYIHIHTYIKLLQ